MSFKTMLAALGATVGIGLLSALPAQAQVQAEGMGDLSAWGERLNSADGVDFPNTLWTGSDNISLLNLLKNVRTQGLTHGERLLLRRVVLSPARKPTGGRADELLSERARILIAIGEAEAAAAIAPRSPEDISTLSRKAAQTDLELARGNEATACATLNAPHTQEIYWSKLRAVCAALRSNYSGAELAVEVASSQGMDDPWFIQAVFAASGDAGAKPAGNFDSGLNIALSMAAELDTSEFTPQDVRPDLVGAIASRTDLSPEKRAAFAAHASELGLFPADEWRSFLLERLADPAYAPTTSIEQALSHFQTPGTSIGAKAEKLAETLSLASNRGVMAYTATARIFQEELETFAPVEPVRPYSMLFARASLMIEHQPLAHHWLESIDYDSPAAPAAFDAAELEALDLIFGGKADRNTVLKIEKKLLQTSTTLSQKAKTRRLLAAFSGLGYRISPTARSYLSTGRATGRSIGQARLFDIKAAINAGALAEASLMILNDIGGRPEKLSALDLATILDMLAQMGAEDIAAVLALEANQIWKP